MINMWNIIFYMITKLYYDLSSDEKNVFIEFLKEAGNETAQSAHGNMWDQNWRVKTNTLMYLLEYTSRFKTRGFYQVVFDGGKVVACGGAYTSDFSNDIAILGARTWIHRDYRHKLISREMLLPKEKEWAINNNHKVITLTFNEYNKNLINLWYRTRLGEQRTARESHHFGFNGVTELQFPVCIQYSKQWILYEKLSDSFDFDWESIRWNNEND